MVRTPLARQIEQDEVLNSVSLLLANLDAAELERVIKHISPPERARMYGPKTGVGTRGRDFNSVGTRGREVPWGR